MTNVLNPKVGLFFVSLLPQFVQAGEGFIWRLLLLAGLFIAMGLVWLTAYTFALQFRGALPPARFDPNGDRARHRRRARRPRASPRVRPHLAG